MRTKGKEANGSNGKEILNYLVRIHNETLVFARVALWFL